MLHTYMVGSDSLPDDHCGGIGGRGWSSSRFQTVMRLNYSSSSGCNWIAPGLKCCNWISLSRPREVQQAHNGWMEIRKLAPVWWT